MSWTSDDALCVRAIAGDSMKGLQAEFLKRKGGGLDYGKFTRSKPAEYVPRTLEVRGVNRGAGERIVAVVCHVRRECKINQVKLGIFQRERE
ncbi:hypothetical protein U3A55_09180 [Salarchaeum sp. III]|uniref:hypothetical protein n=1 Tax=Salarchaeum sp. III TaxID=3107927 RepID=UPI002EDB3208